MRPMMRRQERIRPAGPGRGGAGDRSPAEKRKVTLSTVWRESREIIWRHRSRLALGFGVMLVSRLAGLVLPASSKYLVDRVLVNREVELLGPIALAVVAATVVQALTSFGLVRILGIAAQRAITELRREVQAHVLRLPVRQFDATQSGILLARIMNDAEGIRNLVGTGLVQLAGGLLTAAISMGVLLWINWKLTLGMLVVLLAFGGGMAFAFTRLRPIFRERSKLMAQVSGRLTETLGGIRIVKSYVAERREELVFTKGVHALFRNIATTMTGIGAVTALSSIVVGASGAIMIWIGGQDILAGRMTLGDFVMYVFFTGLMAAPLIQIASIGTQITEAFAGLDRIRELRQMTTEADEDKGREAITRVRGEVEFEDVSFEYVPGVPVLRHVSFHAPAGSTTALVGSSGSGKSTLMSLVMAFNRPTRGRVLLDGRDLATLRLRDYRSHLGIVLQDNFLFDGTIAENIRFSRPDASLEDVQAVSRIAHCDEFIERFPESYQTVVGERGVKLSGGQRQRVAIARAILADPAVLLLDEATSSLDSESEAMIQDGLRTLRSGRTTFVIAHRLSTILSADQILVLEAGEIVERGTHAELHAAGGRYRQLYDKQFKLERDRFINPGEDFTPEPERPTIPMPAGRPGGD
ncbi:MAG TPA: ABC transporter ATP-binding protein [Gemmatimonadales bacterium]|nr:ABC transporter ATP-binding protein [Gemmatimonadales bacterium]